jgi:hypothetical protein
MQTMVTQIEILDRGRRLVMQLDKVAMQFQRGAWRNTEVVLSPPSPKRMTAWHVRWGRVQGKIRNKPKLLLRGERLSFAKGAIEIAVNDRSNARDLSGAAPRKRGKTRRNASQQT